MSVFFHQFDESLEKIFGIVRTGRRFGVVLDGENRQSFVFDAGNRFVIEINVSYFNFGGQRFCFDGETVIVRGNFNLAARQIFYRLIAAAMSENNL